MLNRWYEKLPANWSEIKLKYVADIQRTEAESTENYVGLENIESGTGKFINGTTVPEGSALGFKKGDVLFGKLRPYLAKCWIASFDGCCSTEFFVLRPRSISAEYLWSVLISHSFIEEVNASTAGAKMPRANWDFVGEMAIPMSKDGERIAEFLTKKSLRIDALIESKQQLLTKLSEYRQSLITKAVTKGLGPNSEMKFSGHLAIGDIPAHWHIIKIFNLLECPITDGPHETPKFLSEGIPFISAEAVSGWKIDLQKKRGFISKEYYKECCKKYTPRLGDVYIIKSGATTGRCAIVETGDVFQIWSPLAALRANKNKVLPYFLRYAVESAYFQRLIQDNWSFGTQQNIGMRVIESLKLAVPPLNEQKQIVQYLDSKCLQIDKLKDHIRQSLNKLQKYRSSLITVAVTGKIDI